MTQDPIRRPLLRLVAAISLAVPLLIQGQQRTTTASVSDSVRFKAMLRRASEVLTAQPDSAFVLCTAALELARRSGDPAFIGEAEGWLGYLEEQVGHLETAIAHYERSLAAATEAKDEKGTGTILNNLAAIRKDQGRIEESLDLHQRSLAIKRAIGDSLGVATSLNNIGLILQDQGRLSEALDHYDRALDLFERDDDNDGTGTVLHNIASVFREQGQMDQALLYLQRALAIYEALGDRYSMAYTVDAIGDVLERLGRTEDASTHYQRSLALRMEIGDVRGQGFSRLRIGDLRLKAGDPGDAQLEYLRALDLFTASDDKRGRCTARIGIARATDGLGDPAAARRHGDEALVLARELGNAVLQRDAAGVLVELHRRAGLWKDALGMQDLHIAMRDSIRSDENRRRSIRQEFQYAYGLKEAELTAEQEKRNALSAEEIERKELQRNALLGFAAFGILFAIIDARRRRRIKQEHARNEVLLLNILPEEVAEELKAKGSADAVQFEQVTVLFTDFSGFTALSERMSAKDLVRDLNECFSAFDHICEKHGIEKIKTIGDAYMAAGGLPTPNTTHATDVIKAALEMRDFIAEGKARKVAAGLPFFEIRIGIHTGPVVAGIVGVKKFQYDIWGDTVNTASRMESSGEVGQVNISEATYALVKDEPELTFTPRGKVQAKGKGEMEMHFVSRG